MEPLTSDTGHYDAAFTVYQKKSGKLARDRDWAQNVFPMAVVAKFEKTRPADHTFRSLGIGSGKGELELKLLSRLSQHFPHMEHVVVEPAHELITQYKEAFESSGSAGVRTEAVDIEWRQQTIQQFIRQQENQDHGTKYDFITAVHSLYYVEDVTAAVRFLFDSLAAGGVLMITLSQDNSIKFDTCWGNYASVMDAINELGVNCRSYVQPITVDVSAVLDETSVEGNLLLDFLTHVKHFRKTAPPEILNQRLEFYKNASRQMISSDNEGKDREGENKGDRILVSRNWATLIIDKP